MGPGVPSGGGGLRRGRRGGNLRPGVDRRPSRRSPDRGAGSPDARRHDSAADDVVALMPPAPRRVHGGEGGRQRRDGRLPPRVPPGGAGRPGGRLYRRVQHARNPGHHDGRRTGVLVVNGPIGIANRHERRRECPGPGEPGQPTIGRAVQLVVRNVGGGRPGEIDRATHGSMAKLSFCFAEDEATSPWTTWPRIVASTGRSGRGDRLLWRGAPDPRRPEESVGRFSGPGAGRGPTSKRLAPRVVMGMDGMRGALPGAHVPVPRCRLGPGTVHGGVGRPPDSRQRTTILAGAGGIEEGLPEGHGRPDPPQVSSRRACWSSTPVVQPACSQPIVGGWLNGPMGSEPTSREITP